jgi:hypothetical protein
MLKIYFVFFQYDMEASFLEIYNETIRDLLSTDANTKHEIKQVATNNGKQANDVVVTNLKTVAVQSADQVRSKCATVYKRSLKVPFVGHFFIAKITQPASI